MGAELLRVAALGIGSERQWGWQVLVSPLVTMAVWPPAFLLLLRLRTGARVE
jgi:cell shape-determining protein MreD